MEIEQKTRRLLSQANLRTLINVADALGIDDPARLSVLADAAERWLRHRGVGTTRRAWVQLTWLEWQPAFTGGPASTFSRLPRAERAARLEGRKLAVVREMLEVCAALSAPKAHSSPGA